MTKHLFLLLFTFNFFVLFNTNAEKSTVKIHGIVHGNDCKEIVFSGFEHNPIYEIRKEYTVLVDSNHRFSVEIPINQFSKASIETDYRSKMPIHQEVYFSPGDDVELTIEGNIVQFSGKGAPINNFVSKLCKEKLQESDFSSPLIKGVLTIDEYITSIQVFRNKRLDFLNNYKNIHELSVSFIDYYKDITEIKYRDLIQILYHEAFVKYIKLNTFSHKLKEQTSLSYFTNDKWVKYPEYLSTIYHFCFYGKSIEVDNAIMYKDRWSRVRHVMTDSLQGKTREYVLASRICADLEYSGEYDSTMVNAYFKLATDKFAQDMVKKTIHHFKIKKDLIGKPLHPAFAKTLLADTSNNKLNFSDMMAKYKGKVVYLEAWTTYCGPCRAAMPTSRALEKELAGLPIEFVYINYNTLNQINWNAIFEMTGTSRNHYRSVDGLKSSMNTYVNTSVFPWYMLFDKEGKMISCYAPSPYDIKNQLIQIAKE